MLDAAVERKAQSVKEASRFLYDCPARRKNALLRRIQHLLNRERSAILRTNTRDVRLAEKQGLSPVMLDRLTLNERRITQMIRGVGDVIALPDPVGEVVERVERPNGLLIEKIRVPLGAVGIIYEARPNVTIDSSVLCLKAGNAVLLRGGSEAVRTNKMLAEIVKLALRESKLPSGSVEFVDTTDRRAVLAMLRQDRSLDLIIPRGSQRLIRFIRSHSSIPVISHGEGNCHVFVDGSADCTMAEEIVFNAKVQRPSVCNAAEKLLVHKSIAGEFLPRVARRLKEAGVEIRGDKATRSILSDARTATTADWYTEYLDLILAVKVVDGLDQAIDHIGRFGSHHSDAIVTGDPKHAEQFLRQVDSAAVYVNASTRFTDGFEFGLGAEIGISTQKLHARGPMGLVELTTTKFVVHGTGQIRQ